MILPVFNIPQQICFQCKKEWYVFPVVLEDVIFIIHLAVVTFVSKTKKNRDF